MRAETMSVVEDVVAGEEIDKASKCEARIRQATSDRHREVTARAVTLLPTITTFTRSRCNAHAHRKTVHNLLVWTRDTTDDNDGRWRQIRDR